MGDNEGLARLRQRFKLRLETDRTEFQRMLANLGAPAIYPEMEERAHKLAGLAGSLGFNDISSAAKCLDRPADELAGDQIGTKAALSVLIASISEVCEHP